MTRKHDSQCEEKNTIWIVFPCFNEANRLSQNTFTSFLRSNENVTFCFVNDGSQDNTEEILQEIVDASPNQAVLISKSKNEGKAEAVRYGVIAGLRKKAGYVGYFDADLSAPLAEIHHLSGCFSEQPELILIMGSRVKLMGARIRRKVHRHVLGRIFACVVSLILEQEIYDTQCGAKLFRNTPIVREIFQKPFRSRWIFDVEIIARITRFRDRQDLPRLERLIREKPLREWIDTRDSRVKAADFIRSGIDLIGIYKYLKT